MCTAEYFFLKCYVARFTLVHKLYNKVLGRFSFYCIVLYTAYYILLLYSLILTGKFMFCQLSLLVTSLNPSV